jgi:hypothetical protein
LVWALLPQVRAALNASSGDKHAAQVQRVTLLLASGVAPQIVNTLSPLDPTSVDPAATNGDRAAAPPIVDSLQAHTELTQFLVQLWEGDLRKGLWQTVHGIEGTLALLLALEGADALMTLAQTALREGNQWVKPWQPKEKEAIPRGLAVG